MQQMQPIFFLAGVTVRCLTTNHEWSQLQTNAEDKG